MKKSKYKVNSENKNDISVFDALINYIDTKGEEEQNYYKPVYKTNDFACIMQIALL